MKNFFLYMLKIIVSIALAFLFIAGSGVFILCTAFGTFFIVRLAFFILLTRGIMIALFGKENE